MPQGDKTGPAGAGPQTGRGMGQCGSGIGRAFGRYGCGCGFGFGPGKFGGRYPVQPRLTKKEETEILNEEAEMLEEDLKEVKGRLDELGK